MVEIVGEEAEVEKVVKVEKEKIVEVDAELRRGARGALTCGTDREKGGEVWQKRCGSRKEMMRAVTFARVLAKAMR